MSSTTKTPDQAQEFLASLGLPTDGVTLVADVSPSTPAKPVSDDAEAKAKRAATPASEVVLDAAMIEHITLDKDGKKQAIDLLFAHWKSPHKDKERHALLWRRCTEFVTQVALERKTQGVAKADGVTTKIKASKAQRELADLLAAAGVKPEDLAALLAAKA